MANDGFRIVIERRDRYFYWSFTESGELHESKRGHDSITAAAQDAEHYVRMLKLGRYWQSRRDKAASDVRQ